MAPDRSKSDIITGPLAALKLAQIVAYDSTLNDAAKRVFILIAGYADKEGFAFPSIKKMAKNLGITRQAVIKQVNILIEHSYITRIENFDPNTGRRLTNLYQLNILLANRYRRAPEIFCKHNVTTVVTYFVTLFRYGGMEPLEVTSYVSPFGDTNITNLKKQKKHGEREYNAATSNIVKRKRVHANAWAEEKETEKATGITLEHKKKVAELSGSLRKYKNSAQMVEYDLNMKKKISEMQLSPLEKIEFTIKELERGVAEYSQTS